MAPAARAACRLLLWALLARRSGGEALVRWPQTAITSLAVDRQLVAIVARRHFGYAALSDGARARLEADLREHSCPATIDQAVCVRNLLYKVQLDVQRERIKPKAIAHHFATDAARGVEPCAARFQIAPLEVVRAVVRHGYGASSSVARKVVELVVSFVGADPRAAARLDDLRENVGAFAARSRLPGSARRELIRVTHALTPADWAQFVWACQHDMQGQPKERTMEDAEAGERLLEAHLRTQLQLPVLTEHDLRQRPATENRRSTPDLLIDAPGGARVEGPSGALEGVRWFDMKNMYGTVSCGAASDALLEQLAGKGRRYTTDWGPGAFVLKHGFCEHLGEQLAAELGEGAPPVALLSAASLGETRAPSDGAPGAPSSAAPADSDEATSSPAPRRGARRA